jgi:hypothetical protein
MEAKAFWPSSGATGTSRTGNDRTHNRPLPSEWDELPFHAGGGRFPGISVLAIAKFAERARVGHTKASGTTSAGLARMFRLA